MRLETNTWPFPTATWLLATLALVSPVRANPNLGQWDGPYDMVFDAENDKSIVAVHMVHLPPIGGADKGRILIWPGESATNSTDTVVWDLNDDSLTLVPFSEDDNLFCAGHSTLADGSAFVVGGHIRNHTGLPVAYRFGPDGEDGEWTWQKLPDMEYPRWYPTCTTLADGRVLVTSGDHISGTHLLELPSYHQVTLNGGNVSQSIIDAFTNAGVFLVPQAEVTPNDAGTAWDIVVADAGAVYRARLEDGPCEGDSPCINVYENHIHLVTIPEVYDPASGGWSSLNSADLEVPFYPFMFPLPNGRVFYAGAEDSGGHQHPPGDGQEEGGHVEESSACDNPLSTLNRVLDLDSGPAWLNSVYESDVRGGSAVMFSPGKILKSGGCHPGSTHTQIIDLTANDPQWDDVGEMNHGRRRHTLVMLPDGRVLGVGGTSHANQECQDGDPDPGDGVLPGECAEGEAAWVAPAEIIDPFADNPQWAELASMQTPRMYHSTAMLLPDGRVAVAGGGQGGGAIHDYPTVEYFSPPYLCTNTGQPTIASAPEAIDPGDVFTIDSPDASNVVAVSLIRLGAVTHAFDQSQIFQWLEIVGTNGSSVNVKTPPNNNEAMPGYYMLFLLVAADDGTLVPSQARYIRVDRALPGLWVDFSWLGEELGTFELPFNTLVEGLNEAPPWGLLRIKTGATDATPIINQPVVLDSYNGPAVIGN